ncbi:MFS transporter [Calothrix sp. 336/3]|uniref:MFS transporter n=1 Tax=Calothrix sp. 336/3 TaxID=1337936 RepID=UPI0004E2FF9B|nr:MFS transporter [Calothrix sp. 336/3]AKG21175.1 MFS transporter [Calothrix sp. 336/3]
MSLRGKNKAASKVFLLTIIFLIIEFLDELVDGVYSPALPLIRSDLHLDYTQIGMLLTIPNTIGSIIEPILGIWADIGQRRQLILGGGVAFATALSLISLSHSFSLLLTALVLFNPASGAFVSLSQATLMEIEPKRHEQNMARWALAGSVGNVVGPLIFAFALGLTNSWRSAFFILAILTMLSLVVLWQYRQTIPNTPSQIDEPVAGLGEGIGNAMKALKRREVLLWLTLLQFSDLMLDVLRGFVALYFVDVVGASNTQGSLAITIWLGFGLLGDFLLVPLLERVRGITYLKLSAMVVLLAYPAFLLVPSINIKLSILGLLGLFNAGWYSILKGQLYTAMPGKSGTVLTLSNLFGLVGGLIPLGLGLLAQYYGLGSTMWLLLIAPIALLMGLFTICNTNS